MVLVKSTLSFFNSHNFSKIFEFLYEGISGCVNVVLCLEIMIFQKKNDLLANTQTTLF